MRIAAHSISQGPHRTAQHRSDQDQEESKQQWIEAATQQRKAARMDVVGMVAKDGVGSGGRGRTDGTE